MAALEATLRDQSVSHPAALTMAEEKTKQAGRERDAALAEARTLQVTHQI